MKFISEIGRIRRFRDAIASYINRHPLRSILTVADDKHKQKWNILVAWGLSIDFGAEQITKRNLML